MSFKNLLIIPHRHLLWSVLVAAVLLLANGCGSSDPSNQLGANPTPTQTTSAPPPPNLNIAPDVLPAIRTIQPSKRAENAPNGRDQHSPVSTTLPSSAILKPEDLRVEIYPSQVIPATLTLSEAERKALDSQRRDQLIEGIRKAFPTRKITDRDFGQLIRIVERINQGAYLPEFESTFQRILGISVTEFFRRFAPKT